MERLAFEDGISYRPLELAIHAGRYLPLRKLVRGLRVLDAGCGEGYAAFLMRHVWGAKEVVGVDISESAIKAARQRFRMEGISYWASDLVEFLTSRSNAFDVITCVETLEHLPDAAEVLAHFPRVAKKDSYIYVTWPNDSWYYGSGESLNIHHKRVITFEEFQTLLERHLGPNPIWLCGGVAAGFVTAPVPFPSAESWETAVKRTDIPSIEGLMVPAKKDGGQEVLAATNSLYYAGLWSNGSAAKPDPAVSCALWPASSDYRIADISVVPKYARTQPPGHLAILYDDKDSDAGSDAEYLSSALNERVKTECFSIDVHNPLGVLDHVMLCSSFTQVHSLGIPVARLLIGADLRCSELLRSANTDVEEFVKRWSRPIMSFTAYRMDLGDEEFWKLYCPFFDAHVVPRQFGEVLSRHSSRRHLLGSVSSDPQERRIWTRAWLAMCRQAEKSAAGGVRETRAALIRSLLQSDEWQLLAQKRATLAPPPMSTVAAEGAK